MKRTIIQDIGIILLASVIAVLVRKYFLGALETRIVWVTFYPAVMIAALYGGWITGVLTTGVSCIIALYGWSFLTDTPFIKDFGDQLGTFAFLFNGIMISIVAETARRARIRAIRARDQAQAANNAKSIFLASISHELRAPLNAILGFSNLMLNDDNVLTDHKRILRIINRNGENLLDIINNVLDMAKIEAGRTVLNNNVFDLYGLLQDITDLMRQYAETKDLSLTLDIPEGITQVIVADEGKLRQVVINLISNAIKFTTRGGVILRCASRPPDESGQIRLVIEVEDNGSGISVEDQKCIFEPFIQVGHKSDQKGTGLGLTITRQFVRLMGGKIQVESAPGKGSKFRIEVPVKQSAVPGMAALSTREAGMAKLALGQPEYRILIVEDQAENRQLLSQLLVRAGFRIRAAENGEEGIAVFKSWQPQFIWMDWRMPVMGGLEATRCISAFAEVNEWVDGLRLGAADYITKRFQTEELLMRVRTHLNLKRANISLEQQAALLLATNEQLQTEIIERRQAEEKVKSLLAEKELILKEVHHRIKNNMHMINSLLALHAGVLKEPAAIAALKDAESRVQGMMLLYEKLYQSGNFNDVSIRIHACFS